MTTLREDFSGIIRLGIDTATVIEFTGAHPQARYHLRMPNALQVAVAIKAGCEAFLTNDRDLQRIDDLRILVLDELEL